MDDVYGRVVEERVERRVGAGDAERIGAGRSTLGRAAKHASDLHADPAQLLDVNGPDEPRADDGSADLGDPPHAVAHLLARTA